MEKRVLESLVGEWPARMSAIAGSAYFTVNSSPFGSGFALALGAYAVWDSYIYSRKAEEIDELTSSIPQEKKKEAKIIANKTKESLAGIQASFQCLGALYGAMYGHQAYVHDSIEGMLAGIALSAGYLGLFLGSWKHMNELKAQGQDIYSNITEDKNGRTKGHKTGQR